jgi:hypothetical protein
MRLSSSKLNCSPYNSSSLEPRYQDAVKPNIGGFHGVLADNDRAILIV